MKLRANMPASAYFALPQMSISRLKELRRSPLHYLHARNNPRPPSAAMELGTATHCATLEPERFARDFLVWDRKTDTGRSVPRTGKVWEAFQASAPPHGGVLNETEYGLACAMRDAVRSNAEAMRYLRTGLPEVVMQWQITAVETVEAKGRADWVTEVDGEPVVVGLKTARDCSPRVFSAAAARLGYHLQWAWYADGYAALRGTIPSMVEIVVESAAPHAVVVYRIPDDVLEQGRAEYMALLRLLDECVIAERWPGPAGDAVVDFCLPAWAYERAGEDYSDNNSLDWVS